jgi:hypothetical protein
MYFRELSEGLVQNVGGVVQKKIDKPEEEFGVCPVSALVGGAVKSL